MAAMHEMLEQFPSDGLKLFLFAEEADDHQYQFIAAELTADNFLHLLKYSLDDLSDDEPLATRAIMRFALYTDIEYVEPLTPASSFTAGSSRIDAIIGDFIENNISKQYGLMNRVEHTQLTEIYNPNNLVAFAKQLAAMSPDGLETDQLDMIYRFRTVLQNLAAIGRTIARDDAALNETFVVPKDGARTWAGDVHPYGVQQNGRIDPKEFRDFSEPNYLPRTKTTSYYTVNGHRVYVDGVIDDFKTTE